MFDKTQYKVLIQEYMDKYQVSYTTARYLMSMDQITDHFNISMY
jgi:hypothetical protein